MNNLLSINKNNLNYKNDIFGRYIGVKNAFNGDVLIILQSFFDLLSAYIEPSFGVNNSSNKVVIGPLAPLILFNNNTFNNNNGQQSIYNEEINENYDINDRVNNVGILDVTRYNSASAIMNVIIAKRLKMTNELKDFKKRKIMSISDSLLYSVIKPLLFGDCGNYDMELETNNKKKNNAIDGDISYNYMVDGKSEVLLMLHTTVWRLIDILNKNSYSDAYNTYTNLNKRKISLRIANAFSFSLNEIDYEKKKNIENEYKIECDENNCDGYDIAYNYHLSADNDYIFNFYSKYNENYYKEKNALMYDLSSINDKPGINSNKKEIEYLNTDKNCNGHHIKSGALRRAIKNCAFEAAAVARVNTDCFFIFFYCEKKKFKEKINSYNVNINQNDSPLNQKNEDDKNKEAIIDKVDHKETSLSFLSLALQKKIFSCVVFTYLSTSLSPALAAKASIGTVDLVIAVAITSYISSERKLVESSKSDGYNRNNFEYINSISLLRMAINKVALGDKMQQNFLRHIPKQNKFNVHHARLHSPLHLFLTYSPADASHINVNYTMNNNIFDCFDNLFSTNMLQNSLSPSELSMRVAPEISLLLRIQNKVPLRIEQKKCNKDNKEYNSIFNKDRNNDLYNLLLVNFDKSFWEGSFYANNENKDLDEKYEYNYNCSSDYENSESDDSESGSIDSTGSDDFSNNEDNNYFGKIYLNNNKNLKNCKFDDENPKKLKNGIKINCDKNFNTYFYDNNNEVINNINQNIDIKRRIVIQNKYVTLLKWLSSGVKYNKNDNINNKTKHRDSSIRLVLTSSSLPPWAPLLNSNTSSKTYKEDNNNIYINEDDLIDVVSDIDKDCMQQLVRRIQLERHINHNNIVDSYYDDIYKDNSSHYCIITASKLWELYLLCKDCKDSNNDNEDYNNHNKMSHIRNMKCPNKYIDHRVLLDELVLKFSAATTISSKSSSNVYLPACAILYGLHLPLVSGYYDNRNYKNYKFCYEMPLFFLHFYLPPMLAVASASAVNNYYDKNENNNKVTEVVIGGNNAYMKLVTNSLLLLHQSFIRKKGQFCDNKNNNNENISKKKNDYNYYYFPTIVPGGGWHPAATAVLIEKLSNDSGKLALEYLKCCCSDHKDENNDANVPKSHTFVCCYSCLSLIRQLLLVIAASLQSIPLALAVGPQMRRLLALQHLQLLQQNSSNNAFATRDIKGVLIHSHCASKWLPSFLNETILQKYLLVSKFHHQLTINQRKNAYQEKIDGIILTNKMSNNKNNNPAEICPVTSVSSTMLQPLPYSYASLANLSQFMSFFTNISNNSNNDSFPSGVFHPSSRLYLQIDTLCDTIVKLLRIDGIILGNCFDP